MQPIAVAVKFSSRTKRAGKAGHRHDAPPARTVQSLERAFSILGAIAGSSQQMSLADLSRSTGLHTSTAFHLIKTLIVLGYVVQQAPTPRRRPR